MTEKQHFEFTPGVLLVPMLAVLSIWTVFWFEVRFQINLNHFGIYPRSIQGLRGVLISPFLHSSVEHLYNNTIPLAVLSGALVYFYRSISIKVILMGVLISGILTWIIGRESYHIGASGLIYVLASFIFFKGIFSKHFRLVALSMLVVFLYGGLLWYIFPIEAGISWEGHLGGFLTGLLFALIFKTELPPVKKYKWEEDEFLEEEDDFMKHFDADGNFIENKELSEDNTSRLEIRYHFKKDSDESSAV